MREFARERPRSISATNAERARLKGELNNSIKQDRDYNRATTEANFTSDTAAYNRGALTADQLADNTRAEAAQKALDARSRVESKSATERNIETMMRANPDMSYTEAANIVQNVVSKTTDPLSGRTAITNIAKGTSTPMQSTEPLASSVLNLKPKAAGEGLYSRGANETGVVASLLRGGQKVTGQAGFDIASDESIEVKKE